MPSPPASPDIFDIPIPGAWAMPAADELWLSLAKPPAPEDTSILGDESRPHALKFAQRLFERNAQGQWPLSVAAGNKCAVVLFPEFAFGSADFAELDNLIRQQAQPMIILAGFGAVTGVRIREMVAAGNFECGWANGVAVIDDTKRYNAAWCWIHDPRREAGARHRCYALLKRWPAQIAERLAIPNLALGPSSVRLVADDCEIYPMICSDALCTDANGPHAKVVAAIQSCNHRREMILIPVLMLEGKPSHAAWRSRLEHLISTAPRKVAVVMCNHVSVGPLASEDDDCCRCLSGALVGIDQFLGGHREPPGPVRVLKHSGVAGYVVRSSSPAIVSGLFVWREIALHNRFIWLPNSRQDYDGTDFKTEDIAAAHAEMMRWPERVPPPAWIPAHAPGAAFIKAGLVKTRQALRIDRTDAIWTGVLDGRGLGGPIKQTVDEAGSVAPLRIALNYAFEACAAIIQVPGWDYEPQGGRRHFVRAAAGGKGRLDLLVWSAIEGIHGHVLQQLEAAVSKGCFSGPTVVLAHAPGGPAATFQRIVLKPTSDISNPPPADPHDIAEPGLPPIFWMPIGDIHHTLNDQQWAELPEAQRAAAIAGAIETLVSRVA